MFWRCFCGNTRSINFWPTINDVFSIHSSNIEDCHSPDCVTLYLRDANWNNLPIDNSVSIWKCCWAASVSTRGKRKYDELSHRTAVILPGTSDGLRRREAYNSEVRHLNDYGEIHLNASFWLLLLELFRKRKTQLLIVYPLKGGIQQQRMRRQ